MLDVANVLANEPPDPAPEDCWSQPGNFNSWLAAEFEWCREQARANPQWIERLETDGDTKLVAAADWLRWCLALTSDQIPVSNSAADRRQPVINFIRFVNACLAGDANGVQWQSEMDAMVEDVSALANTITAEVQRTCKNMPDKMTDYVRHPRTQEPLSNNSDNVRFLLKSIDAEVRFNNWLERIEIKSGDGARWLGHNPEMQWKDWTPVDDQIVSVLRAFASRTGCDFRPAKDFLWDALYALARSNIVDPAIERLAELEANWDGVSRLHSWLLFAAQCPDDEYHYAVARNIVGGMVRRIREPGCKHDTIALLIGAQGAGKSTLARMLAPIPEWFADTVQLGDESKELVLSLAGKAVAEISELSGSNRDMAKIKAMISRTTDAGRTAYARTVTERPRRNIFVASTNDSSPLIDSTGNRRFLPVRIESEIEISWLKRYMPQIIGEAAWRHTRGEKFEIPRHLWTEAAMQQECARQQSRHEIFFAEWFAPSDLAVFITAADLASIVRSIEPGARNYTDSLRKFDFTMATKRVDGKPAKVWHRGDLANASRLVPRLREGTLVPSLLFPALPAGTIMSSTVPMPPGVTA